MRGMALKAAGAALLADVRAAVNTARRTANAAMREMDCIMVMRAIFVWSAAFKWRRSLPLPAAHASRLSQRHISIALTPTSAPNHCTPSRFRQTRGDGCS